MIEQAKSSYFSLGKTFKKQKQLKIKTKVKVIEKHENHLAQTNGLVKKDDFDIFDSEKSFFLRQKNIFNEVYGKRLKKQEI